jgi:hypothetical protein
MKSPSVSLFIILFFILIQEAKALPISLQEAISKKMVKAVISGRGSDDSRKNSSTYYGPCLTLDLQSLSRVKITIELENGRFLETIDTTEQRMIVTREEQISILPGQKGYILVYAMCTQMHDHAPAKGSLLALGPMADGNLLQLTRFIGKKNYQGLAAQEAIWVITDNNDLGSIYSNNTEELQQLQQLVSELTGKVIPPAPHRIEYAEGIVTGEIIFKNEKPETYTLIIVNEAGETLGTFFDNETTMQPTVTTLHWKFRYKGFPKGVYYVKLKTLNDGEIASRPVVIN